MTYKCTMSKEDIIYDLKNGLAAEHNAVDLCKELLNILEDEEDKKIISSILKDEERHVKIANDLINVVDTHYIN